MTPRQPRRFRDARPHLLNIDKYYRQRYALWSKFDEGVKMTAESYYEVTPEAIARHIAERLVRAVGVSSVLVDVFAGVGSNAIALAQAVIAAEAALANHPVVLAVERNVAKAHMLQHNARVYGVPNAIEIVVGDAFRLVPAWSGKVDAAFMSPPWGGPAYRCRARFRLDAMRPYTGREVFQLGWHATPNVAVLLPRTTPARDIAQATARRDVEVEENWLHGRRKTLTVYSGALVAGDVATASERPHSPRPFHRCSSDHKRSTGA